MMQDIEQARLKYYLDQALPILSKEEEKVKFQRYFSGETYLADELVRHNLRLVIVVAKKYLSSGIDFDDLMQLGCFGLMKAIRKFNLERNCKFSTYAYSWIRQPISKEIKKRRKHNYIFLEDIRIKVMHNFNKSEDFITEEDILKSLIINFNEKVCSVDSSSEEKLNWGLQSGLIEDLIFDSLDPRQVKILYSRFFEDRSLRETKSEVNLSIEMLRQIQRKALDILREKGICKDLIVENFSEK